MGSISSHSNKLNYTFPQLLYAKNHVFLTTAGYISFYPTRRMVFRAQLLLLSVLRKSPHITQYRPQLPLQPNVHSSNAILRNYYRNHNNTGNIRNKPISLIGRRTILLGISNRKKRKMENDTLGRRSYSIGRGDIGNRETGKGPTKRAYVRWASGNSVVLVRGQAHGVRGFPDFSPWTTTPTCRWLLHHPTQSHHPLPIGSSA